MQRALRGGPGRPSPGRCSRSCAAAGTRGWRGTLGLAGQHLVRPGPGRPRPGRGTRIRPSMTWNCGLSPRWPAVMSANSGFWVCSQGRCAGPLFQSLPGVSAKRPKVPGSVLSLIWLFPARLGLGSPLSPPADWSAGPVAADRIGSSFWMGRVSRHRTVGVIPAIARPVLAAGPLAIAPDGGPAGPGVAGRGSGAGSAPAAADSTRRSPRSWPAAAGDRARFPWPATPAGRAAGRSRCRWASRGHVTRGALLSGSWERRFRRRVRF